MCLRREAVPNVAIHPNRVSKKLRVGHFIRGQENSVFCGEPRHFLVGREAPVRTAMALCIKTGEIGTRENCEECADDANYGYDDA